jgi:hypothetical protein
MGCYGVEYMGCYGVEYKSKDRRVTASSSGRTLFHEVSYEPRYCRLTVCMSEHFVIDKPHLPQINFKKYILS